MTAVNALALSHALLKWYAVNGAGEVYSAELVPLGAPAPSAQSVVGRKYGEWSIGRHRIEYRPRTRRRQSHWRIEAV